MKKFLLVLAILVAPVVAHANYLDVITAKFKDGCTVEKYMGLVEEFRSMMKEQGYSYTVEIAIPFSSDELGVMHWIGRSPSLGSFGQETDRFNAAVAKGGTPEAAWMVKSEACTENLRRTGNLVQ